MKKTHKVRNTIIIVVAILLVTGVSAALMAYWKATYRYTGFEKVRIYIPSGATAAAVRDTLEKNLGDFGREVYNAWSWQKGQSEKAYGSYVISPGDRVITVSRNLLYGRQHPLNITFNNVRTLDQLAEKVAARFTFTSEDFMRACDSILPEQGYGTPELYPAAFAPDTYQLYWTAGAGEVVEKLAASGREFWNEERRAKAHALGLSPQEVATLASIVEEETNQADEQPLVARLYLNRLAQGIKLQADPTVKFAVGDFTLRRITGKHTAVQSPYNTYQVQGLPPGPIRIAEKKTLDAVLDAPVHDYIYMCARPDTSGHHAFAKTYQEHLDNAAAYHRYLNARNIK
ncbi:MAG: endolytic transglycosylase MltG [Muribaculaceae bacterium]|nr:endolytic transglycosylase MltG [Muribaculaceae bacterium]